MRNQTLATGNDVIRAVRIEVGEQIVLVGGSTLNLPANADVHGQVGKHLPVVLKVDAPHTRTFCVAVGQGKGAARWTPQQHGRETLAKWSGRRIVERPARESGVVTLGHVSRQPIVVLVLHVSTELSAELKAMGSPHLGERLDPLARFNRPPENARAKPVIQSKIRKAFDLEVGEPADSRVNQTGDGSGKAQRRDVVADR